MGHKKKRRTRSKKQSLNKIERSVPQASTSLLLRRPVVGLFLLCVAGLSLWFWPSLITARFNFSSAQRLIEKDPAAATALLEEAVELRQGDFPKAQLLWSRALLRSGRKVEAVGCFSLIENPQQLDAEKLISLGDEAVAQQVALLARFAYVAVPVQSDLYIRAQQKLVPVKYQEQRWNEVIEICDRIQADEKLETENLYLLAVSYERMSNFAQSQEKYAEYVSKRESDDQLRLNALRSLARMATQLGEIESAKTWLEMIQNETNFTTEDTLTQAKLLLLQGLQDDAEMLVGEVLQQQPNEKEALLLSGSLAFARGEFSAAEADFRNVLELDQWNREAHYKLAQILQRNDSPEAEAHFKRNRELNEIALRILDLQSQPAQADDTDRIKKLAQAYADLGQFEMAKRIRANLK